jgi:hypothetical protein
MRREHSCAYRKVGVWVVAAVVLGFGASASSAQFGLKLPKIPKLGKKESTPAPESKEKAAQLPAIEVTSVTPDSAPLAK